MTEGVYTIKDIGEDNKPLSRDGLKLRALRVLDGPVAPKRSRKPRASIIYAYLLVRDRLTREEQDEYLKKHKILPSQIKKLENDVKEGYVNYVDGQFVCGKKPPPLIDERLREHFTSFLDFIENELKDSGEIVMDQLRALMYLRSLPQYDDLESEELIPMMSDVIYSDNRKWEKYITPYQMETLLTAHGLCPFVRQTLLYFYRIANDSDDGFERHMSTLERTMEHARKVAAQPELPRPKHVERRNRRGYVLVRKEDDDDDFDDDDY